MNIIDYYPKRPYGFGMSDKEVRPLLRGYRSGGLLECLGLFYHYFILYFYYYQNIYLIY